MADTPALFPYCADRFSYRRRRTRAVMAGGLGIGGDNPLRVQSMTTTDTLDAQASIAQAARLAEAGCELVRLTAPTLEAARALEKIRSGLDRRGIRVPLAADVHFLPEAALAAADFVEKIRINPGNFADSKTFAASELSDAQYLRELDRVRRRLVPLLDKLKRLKRALRIGVNHGSLSDRVLGRYGDTPLGMVESALEFARLCEEAGYRELVFSMKSSNVKVMIAAYRLLAARMAEAGMDYPFHLGVTEAGEGEDGRIKSAVGIGSLLEDGIGDTLRVSLTEAPEAEIPVCLALAERFQGRRDEPSSGRPSSAGDPYSYRRRASRRLRVGGLALGGGEPIRAVGAPAPGCEIAAWVARPGGGRPPPAGPARLLRVDGPLALGLEAIEASGPAGPQLVSWPGWRETGEPAFLAALKGRGAILLAEAVEPEEALRRGRRATEAGVEAALGLAGVDDPGTLLRRYRVLAETGGDFPIHLRAPKA
ncbi:MAG: (E)-4-hydroxy-3-methylbut-2-enyl-diphosphate synthase, partial [Elusimicrobia bacterium]|nr:(E)-4-hydroxy-3-methylbut-2-enyl-diphosphate synthase [Elusimicrobiota bacterium]